MDREIMIEAHKRLGIELRSCENCKHSRHKQVEIIKGRYIKALFCGDAQIQDEILNAQCCRRYKKRGENYV